MKITKPLLVSLAVIFLSCGDDEDPEPTNDGLAGAWTATGIDYSGTTVITIPGTTNAPITGNFTGTGKNMALTVTFKENPATFTSDGSYTIALATTISGQTINQDYPFTGFLANGTWVQNGQVLTVTSGPNGPQQATIVEQTSTTLIMKWDYVYNISQQGSNTVMNIKGTYTFKRK
jgi:hypothetical protein